ncbi:MAG TPA: RHS repeat-associated core domain-containing protein, partial [Candidatus Dormibacteraeota bacterium]|nr:RHS repeat-associated core domain-containing protein [Candidatus Dormibacteraeota bacterium]
ITVNGYAVQANYSQTLNTTGTAMASALTSLLNASGSPVTATSSGDVITLTAKVKSSGSNYSLSASSATTDPNDFTGSSYGLEPSGSTLTGGEDDSKIYDAGTVSITVNGNIHATVNYTSSSTGTTVASALASALSDSLVTATASGNVVHITSVATGADTNYTLSATSESSNPSQFNPPSFTTAASGSTLTGGAEQNITGAAYTLDMGYAGNGNVLSAQDSVNGNWTYSYDAMNRLATSACAGNSTAKCPDNAATQGYKYLYDRFGNRWQQDLTAGTGPAPQYSFDANNHMIGASYDAAGNMLNDGYHSYVYDAENRIIQVDGGSTATYTYDAEGRRVRKVAGTTVDYVYDHAARQIAEVNTSGGWTRQEVYVGGRHLATYSGTTTYFHNSDWLGTERVRTDVNGVVYESCQGLPYGDEQACAGGEPSPMHFTGKQRDTETNLDDFPARYYSSVQGRWLSPDWDTKPVSVPYAILGNPQTLNLYSYVGGDPTNHADPDGHMNLNALSTANTASWEDYYEDQRGQAGSVLHDTAQNTTQPKPPDNPKNLQLVPTADDGKDHQSYREVLYEVRTKDGKQPEGTWYVTEHQTNKSVANQDGVPGVSGGKENNKFTDLIGCLACRNVESKQTFTISTTPGVKAKSSFPIFVHSKAGDFGTLGLHIDSGGVRINGGLNWFTNPTSP